MSEKQISNLIDFHSQTFEVCQEIALSVHWDIVRQFY